MEYLLLFLQNLRTVLKISRICCCENLQIICLLLFTYHTLSTLLYYLINAHPYSNDMGLVTLCFCSVGGVLPTNYLLLVLYHKYVSPLI